MKQIDCTTIRSQFEDLLFEPEAVSSLVRSHLANCAACRGELEELQATMAKLDVWEAPEPNPFFMTRFAARLEEERQAGRRGWLARLRAGIAAGLFEDARAHLRPMAATALTVLLLVGGGAYMGVTNWMHVPQQEIQTAVVSDLENMDSNAQLLDRLESLSNEDSN